MAQTSNKSVISINQLFNEIAKQGSVEYLHIYFTSDLVMKSNFDNKKMLIAPLLILTKVDSMKKLMTLKGFRELFPNGKYIITSRNYLRKIASFKAPLLYLDVDVNMTEYQSYDTNRCPGPGVLEYHKCSLHNASKSDSMQLNKLKDTRQKELDEILDKELSEAEDFITESI